MRPESRLALIGAAQRWSDRLPARWARRARDVGKIAVDHRGQRRTALRHVRYALARRASPILAAPFGPGQLLVDARDDEIGRSVFITGGYERWHMEAAVAQLRARGWDPAGRVFVDVGANIGTSTVDALLQFGFGRAHCFEPDAANVRLLRANLVWNGLDDRADVHPVALSDSDGRGLLRRSPDNSGDHRFTAGQGGPDECRRLDAYVEDGTFDPAAVGLLWIDAQGHEPHVLRGAAAVLTARVPVVLEYCPWILGPAIADLDELILANSGTVVNLNRVAEGGSGDLPVGAAGLADLARRYATRGYADLLLLPPVAAGER